MATVEPEADSGDRVALGSLSYISTMMWWRRLKHSDSRSTESVAELRAQLTEACEALRHQIEVQNSVRFSRGGGYGGDDLAVLKLQQQLEDCEMALAGLDLRDGGEQG